MFSLIEVKGGTNHVEVETDWKAQVWEKKETK